MKTLPFIQLLILDRTFSKKIKIFQKRVDIQLKCDIIVFVVDIKQHFSKKENL